MKKVISLMLITAIIFITSSFSCAQEETGMKLFYNGYVHNLKEPVLMYNDEYYFDAVELASSLGMDLSFPGKNKVILVFNGFMNEYDILSDNGQLKPTEQHTLPVYINNKLYFPFSFLKLKQNLVISYNKDKNFVYLFNSNNRLTLFENISYGYKVDLSKNGFKISEGDSNNSFNDSTINFINAEGNLTTSISCDKLDNDALLSMRKYLGDDESDDAAIFDKFAEYKKSYFDAMKDYYKRSFLFSNNDEISEEPNMKVFGQYDENLFGIESEAVLYNQITAGKYSSQEHTYLNLTIPVPSYMTVYSISFSVTKGDFSGTVISDIANFISTLSFKNLSSSGAQLKALQDTTAVDNANLGIYPDFERIMYGKYSTYKNDTIGYEYSCPSTYVPYNQNSLVGLIDYNSYKINYNSFFSVAAETAYAENAALEKINFIKTYNKNNIKISEEDHITIGGNLYYYIKYQIIKPEGISFISDYVTVNGSRLVDIQLNSRFITPSVTTEDQFIKTLASFKFHQVSKDYSIFDIPYTKLSNNYEGYSVYYPYSWQKTDDGNDINYDSFTLKTPSYSGPLQVLFSEGELNKSLDYHDILKYVTGIDIPDYKKYFKKYWSPYLNTVTKPLYMSARQKSGCTYLYKLVNYLDASGRDKLCYSVDIIRDNKIFSIFIVASDYITKNGTITDQRLNRELRLIGSMFDVDNTPEYREKKAKGEKRNFRVVFIENYLNKLANGTKVTSIDELDSSNHLLVASESSEGNYFYRLHVDFSKNIITIDEKLSKKEVLEKAIQKLKNLFWDKNIENISTDEKAMYIRIKYNEKNTLTPIERLYHVNASLVDGKLQWEIERNNYSDALLNDMKNFLNNYLSSNVRTFFNPDDDLSLYENNKKNGKPYYTAVYTEFGGMSGYFILKINPVDDGISLDSYIPSQMINDRIGRMFSQTMPDYDITSIKQSKNKFEYLVILMSRYNKSYKLTNVKVTLNPDTQKLNLE